jgi:hypothetical protein
MGIFITDTGFPNTTIASPNPTVSDRFCNEQNVRDRMAGEKITLSPG